MGRISNSSFNAKIIKPCYFKILNFKNHIYVPNPIQSKSISFLKKWGKNHAQCSSKKNKWNKRQGKNKITNTGFVSCMSQLFFWSVYLHSSLVIRISKIFINITVNKVSSFRNPVSGISVHSLTVARTEWINNYRFGSLYFSSTKGATSSSIRIL